MSHLIFESILFWAIFVLILGGFGWCFLTVLGKKKIGGALLGLAILSLISGYICVCQVKTDRKVIRETILQVAKAIENNDVEKVITYLASDAEPTKQKARIHMRRAHIDWTKVRDFKIIEINHYTSPPTAHVRFTGSVSGRAVDSGIQFTIPVRFTDVELIKEEDNNWYITEQCRFVYHGYNGD